MSRCGVDSFIYIHLRFTLPTQQKNSILLDLTYLKAEVAPCFPQSYDIMATFRTQYERHLVANIGKLYNTQRGFPGLDQGELLQLMEWLDYYNQEVRFALSGVVFVFAFRDSFSCPGEDTMTTIPHQPHRS